MADLYGLTERVMGMGDADWRRHANPWSVWTRFSCLPLLVIGVWSRVWLGWWALVAVGAAVLWIWVNPRVFPAPRDFGTWASRVTLGERVFLARDIYGVPVHHVRAAHILSALTAVGIAPLIYGLIVLNPWAALLGVTGTVLLKVWFCDRMVWLHADLTHTVPGDPMPEPLMPPERTRT